MKKNVLLFLCLLLFFLSGCSQNNTITEKDDSWKSDILMAQECGMDGLPCCLDKDQPCKYEQSCCFDPNNPERHFCADDCICGKENAFCCAGNTCDSGLACNVNGLCSPCGGNEEICCEREEKCGESLICHQNKCVECGFSGYPCCEGEAACLNQDLRNENRTECRNNICLRCGDSGQSSCQGEPKCNAGNLLNNNSCFKCGRDAQPCCQINEYTKFECMDKSLECKFGFCSKIN